MKKLISILFVVVFSVSFAFAQKTAKPAIFAIIDDGKMIEPIAFINKGKIEEPLGDEKTGKTLSSLIKNYYKPKTVYKLVFGGANAGKVSVVSNDPKSECGKSMANVTSTSAKAKFKFPIMALATNATITKKTGVRRMPTAAERKEIESLVRGEFTANNVSEKAALKYQNFTAIDVDNDKSVEFVGSYWAANNAKERSLLFFIAEKNADGKYQITSSSFSTVKQDEVMSGNIKDIDDGRYHELFIDYLDYDNDGTGEIFTMTQGFEGNNFYVYKKGDKGWVKVLEYNNYHCAN
jgi:hypothetical protein